MAFSLASCVYIRFLYACDCVDIHVTDRHRGLPLHVIFRFFILTILSSLDRTIPVQALHILILTEEVYNGCYFP